MNDENDTTMDLANVLARFEASLNKTLNETRAIVAAAPPCIPCARHPGHPDGMRPVRFSATLKATNAAGKPTPGYGLCKKCRRERAALAVRARLERQGVPPILSHGMFANWEPQSADDKRILEIAKVFATQQRRGFLVFLGRVGTGKGHLAVSIMRHFRYGLFIKHSTLLERKRDTYHDPDEPDPVKECQRMPFLVLDEIGVSGGGRDDLPVIQSVLDHRIGRSLPTVLTSNLDLDKLTQAIGIRLVDRLKESAYAVCTFGGQSWRSKMWSRIFKGKRPE